MGIVFSKENKNYDKENGTPTVLLLGNGFDLQLGLKSRYEDFLLYIFNFKLMSIIFCESNKKYIYKNNKENSKIEYGDILKKCIKEDGKYKNEEINRLSNIIDIAEKRFNNLLIDNNDNLELFKNNIFLSCLVSILSQESDSFLPINNNDNIGKFILNIRNDYINFNKLLSECNSQGDTSKENSDDTYFLFKNLITKFVDLIECPADCDKKGRKNLKKINGWLDVESIIECLLTKSQHLLTRFSINSKNDESDKENAKQSLSEYCDELDLKDNLENAYEIREAIKQFTHEFCKFIQIQVDHIKDNVKGALKLELNKEIEFYKSGKDAPFIVGIDLFSNIYEVLNYNYSSLAEFFEEYSNITLHVNGKSEDETAIFGINEDIGKEALDTQNKYSTYFYKQTQRVLNHVPGVNYESYSTQFHWYKYPKAVAPIKIQGFNLIIYGHSCSPADFDVIKTLLTHPNLRVAVVLCYNKEAMLSAYHNIRTMLGPQKIAEMMQVSSKMEKRLFFLERKTPEQ